MAVSVEIDEHSGFCGGVINAIGSAEKFLQEHPGEKLYSLGAIVHNEAELSRLAQEGLITIDYEDLEHIRDAGGRTLLIRAHGEPPHTYARARELGFNIADCTCPVVLKIQQRIREAYQRLHSTDKPGQIVIFGKIGHAEVLGLVGQVDGDALVVEDLDQLRDLVETGLIRTSRDIEMFSQTTMSPVGYEKVHSYLRESMTDGGRLTVHETICHQMSSRHRQLSDFALVHDIVLFVAGRASSNGKVLSSLCKSVNIRTYHITGTADINPSWFRPDDNVGVCGATSTPKWLLEEVAAYVENLQR
ncbi:MAG: 4-hydroxy-3-methylbut-2-enyl diphosphate reductase [Bacteroidales bacterium]|nr:4-hydroxy-3-methylbut-2-enyl diphosphate reductase [Bacteroidales bacterium]